MLISDAEDCSAHNATRRCRSRLDCVYRVVHMRPQKRLCASRGERCVKLHESAKSDTFPVSWHDLRQGVLSTNTDGRLVCLITCSGRQAVLQPSPWLSGRQSILLCLLQIICKNCPRIGVSRCFFERCAQNLAAALQLQTRFI